MSEKLAAQAAPILGAIGGAAVNAAFADHFQTLARGHFIVRRLERDMARASSRSNISACAARRRPPPDTGAIA